MTTAELKTALDEAARHLAATARAERGHPFHREHPEFAHLPSAELAQAAYRFADAQAALRAAHEADASRELAEIGRRLAAAACPFNRCTHHGPGGCFDPGVPPQNRR